MHSMDTFADSAIYLLIGVLLMTPNRYRCFADRLRLRNMDKKRDLFWGGAGGGGCQSVFGWRASICIG
jgi:hypothetical protein